MVRSEDPPGKVKHVRFGKISDDVLTNIKTFPGVKAVVLHTHGKRGEHPHYHIWWESDTAVTNQTIRNRLQAHHVTFKSFSGQNDWSIRNHDSWDKWAAYVTENPTHMVLLDYANLKELSEKKQLPIVATGGTAEAAVPTIVKYSVQKPRRNESMRAKFVNYLSKELHWHKESITLENRVSKKKEMIELLVDYWENAFTTPQGAACIEHAMWYFADEELNVELKLRAVARLNEILRC